VGGRWDFIGENHSEIIQWMVMSSHVLFGSSKNPKLLFLPTAEAQSFFKEYGFYIPYFGFWWIDRR